MKRRYRQKQKRQKPSDRGKNKKNSAKMGASSKPRFQFPSDLDVETFAAELGMDLEFDSDQRWLIDQALESSLPPLWTRFFNPSGRSYYVRQPTKQDSKEVVTWVHPLVPAYSKIFDNILADQLEAQKAALGIVSDDEEDDNDTPEEFDAGISFQGNRADNQDGPKLSSKQRKKLRASLQDALLYYKKIIGDPATEDVRPHQDVPGFWDVEPDDVEEMANYLDIDKEKQPYLMWIARIAAAAPLPPGWTAHSDGDDISNLCAESRMVSLEELGIVYTCKSWMCKTDAISARMALDVHPSEAYINLLLGEARQEYGADSQDGDDGYEDAFFMEPEVIPCEFATENGNIYIYDFIEETVISTGRCIKDSEEPEYDAQVDAEETDMHKDRKDSGSASDPAKIEPVENTSENVNERINVVSKEGTPTALADNGHSIRDTITEQSTENTSEAMEKMYAGILNPVITDVPSPGPGIALMIRLVDEGGLSEKQVTDFAKHIGLDLNARKDAEFLWIMEEALLLKREETATRGWVYRSDPDGKFHYFCDRSMRQIDLTKGMEIASGWETESQNNGKNTDRNKTFAGVSTEVLEKISSKWRHPLAAKYKKQLSDRRKELDEKRRLQRVRGLRAKSSVSHCKKMNEGRKVGGQAIVIDHQSGEPLLLHAPDHTASIQRPSVVAEKAILAVSPNKRAIPLQPGFFKEAKIRHLKNHKAEDSADNELDKQSSTETSKSLPRINDTSAYAPEILSRDEFRRDDEQLQENTRQQHGRQLHRAFRDVNLVDTTDLDRKAEESRTLARRRKRAGNKYRRRRKDLDESNPAMTPGSNASFPPLKLDASCQLGVVSLSYSVPNLSATESFQLNAVKNKSNSNLVLLGKSQGKESDPDMKEIRKDLDNRVRQKVLEKKPASSPKKGILSPSHQGKFAACGNLVPLSTLIWESVHEQVGAKNTRSKFAGPRGQDFESEMQDEKVRSFCRKYDESHAKEEEILDRWLKQSIDGESVLEHESSPQLGDSSHLPSDLTTSSIEMSTSTSIRNIQLRPLPPRTPVSAGSLDSTSSIGSLGIRGPIARDNSVSRGIATPPVLSPLEEMSKGMSQNLDDK